MSNATTASVTVARRYRLGRMRFMPSLGEAFDGFDLDAQRQVTVWTLPQIRPSLAKLFLDQHARAAKADPSLTPEVWDQGIDVLTGKAYVVFEPLRVRRLCDALRDHEVSRDRAMRMFMHMTHSLVQVSSKNVVHGRLNPMNVVVTEDSEHIIGFGLSYAQRIDSLPPALVPYLAPEQLKGHISTPECDLYAAAMILYSSLIGDSVLTSLVVEQRSDAAAVSTIRLVQESLELDAPTRAAILSLLTCDAAARPAEARRILQHWKNGSVEN